MDSEIAAQVEKAIRADGRYPPAAFEFLHRGLEYTTRAVHTDESSQKPMHVSGQQLCEGLYALARESWGPLAQIVLAQWNIHSTRDFGEMVFLLIGLQIMGRQESDTIEDFDNVYDFEDAFGSYEIRLNDRGRMN